MLCPRCKSAVSEGAEACPRCEAPLRLRDEPAPSPIDGDLDLDRRSLPRTTPSIWPADEEETAPGRPPPPRAAPPPAEPSGPPAGARRPQGPGRRAPGAAQAQVPLPFPAEVRLRRAPSGRRLASWAADGILVGALAWLLVAGGARLAGGEGEGWVLWPHALVLAALLHFAHATLGHALSGRTLGKWMAGLLLVGPDGRRPGPGRAALRALLSLLSAAPAGLGLLLALFDRKGRALHDLAAGTAVVRAP